MKTLRFILATLVAMLLVACSQPLGKSISEPLTSEEMVKICQKHTMPNFADMLTKFASSDSHFRNVHQGTFVEYGDVTYDDLVDIWDICLDTVREARYKEKYNEYQKSLTDSVWTRLCDIRNEIKNDTMLHNSAKFRYELGKNNSYGWRSRTMSVMKIKIDTLDPDISSVGGIVSKVFKDDESSSVCFYFFKINKYSKDNWTLKEEPTRYSDTIDFFSGKYDYSINTLWYVKDKDTTYSTTKELFNLLESNRRYVSMFSSAKGSYSFEKKNIQYDRELQRIVKYSFMSEFDYINKQKAADMKNENARAYEFFSKVSKKYN